MGQRETAMITVGEETEGGKFESFAFWTRFKSTPHFFITEDDKNGTVRRFVPDSTDWSDPWDILLGAGTSWYLLLDPSTMTYTWTPDLQQARRNAGDNFPGSEGLDQFDDHLYFISKILKKLVILNLLNGTYSEHSTDIGRFDAQPDQIVRIKLPDASDTLFFTQDGDNMNGIAARNSNGTYTIVNTVGHDEDETTGLAFSPDGKHMLFAVQDAGILYDITRDDGLGFHVEPPVILYDTEASTD